MPMFDAYGKMQTGLTKLDLSPPSRGLERVNEGLLPPPQKGDNTEWQIDDPVWKASKILDQLERMEKTKADVTTNRGGFKTFGEIQSVPWLDKMTKDYCEQTLSEARTKNAASIVRWFFPQYQNVCCSYSCVNDSSFDQCMTQIQYPHI